MSQNSETKGKGDEVTDSRHLIEVLDAPGKGKGVFAKAAIPCGIRIIAETALLPTKPGFDAEEILDSYNALTNADQQAYLGLFSYVGPDLKSQAEKGLRMPWNAIDARAREVLAIAVTNMFSQGVFLLGSRINHSCIPNVNFTFNENLKKTTFHAVRDIEKGEELTLSYLDVANRPRATRQSELAPRGFQCSCPACEDTPEGREMEQQRAILFKLDYELAILHHYGGGNKESWKHALESVQKMSAIQNSLGLITRALGITYHDALRFNIKLGNRKMAVLWGEKQLQNELICLGDDHPDYKETLAMVDQLRNFARLSLLPIDDLVMDWV